MQKWKIKILEKIKKQIEDGKKLNYIHIPKTAGTFVRWVIAENFPEIGYIQHKQAPTNDNNVYFTTIREPTERLESLFNMVFWYNDKIDPTKLKIHIPKHLHYVFEKKNVSLNNLISLMTDAELTTSLGNFQTLKHYSKNVDLLITIDEFLPTLQFLGFDLKKQYPKNNVSEKTRGTFSKHTKERIEKLYKDDVKLWKLWTRKDQPL